MYLYIHIYNVYIYIYIYIYIYRHKYTIARPIRLQNVKGKTMKIIDKCFT